MQAHKISNSPNGGGIIELLESSHPRQETCRVTRHGILPIVVIIELSNQLEPSNSRQVTCRLTRHGILSIVVIIELSNQLEPRIFSAGDMQVHKTSFSPNGGSNIEMLKQLESSNSRQVKCRFTRHCILPMVAASLSC